MALVVNCRDVGADCDFEACADTEEELFKILAEHAKSGHGMEEIPPELVEKVRAVIREE
jgi:predicted small metal-binding protein